MRLATLAAAALAAAALTAPSPSAVAAPIDKGHFHDVESDSFICESNGLPVGVVDDISGNFLFNQRGSGLAYYRESVRGTTTFTNLRDGGTYSNVFTSNFHDAKITDNGDGTITIDSYGAGGSRWYDNAGKLVLKDPGNIRFRIVIDLNGTPGDPSDDIELSFDLLRESTGRNDTDGRDFCDDVLIFSAA